MGCTSWLKSRRRVCFRVQPAATAMASTIRRRRPPTAGCGRSWNRGCEPSKRFNSGLQIRDEKCCSPRVNTTNISRNRREHGVALLGREVSHCRLGLSNAFCGSLSYQKWKCPLPMQSACRRRGTAFDLCQLLANVGGIGNEMTAKNRGMSVRFWQDDNGSRRNATRRKKGPHRIAAPRSFTARCRE